LAGFEIPFLFNLFLILKMDSFIFHDGRSRGEGAFKNCNLCHGMGVDAEMGQSVTGQGRDVKKVHFEKRFLALRVT
jgi:hypothetical protein